MTGESEKVLERRLAEGARSRGGIAVKLTSQFHRGLPDRLVLLPRGRVAFVELKSTGRRRDPLQVVAARRLEAMGFPTFLVDRSEALEEFWKTMDKNDEI